MDDSGSGAARVSTRHRLMVAAGLAGGVAAVALLAGWIERRPIVRHFVDDRLTAAHVPAGYRLVAIGPFEQRLADVRIGDPAAPDLTARDVELVIGYGWHGPYLAAVHATGIRLAARVAGGRVSLGSIDRLLPPPSGTPFSLPDIDVDLRDMRLALDTPAVAIGASIAGSGRLTDGFSGRATIAAALLAAGGCAIRGARADWRVTIAAQRPHVAGPLDLAALACPGRKLALGQGHATLDMTFAPTLDHGQGGVALAGFAGDAGSLRFSGASGLVTLVGDARRIAGSAGLTLADPASAIAGARSVALGGGYRYVPGAAGLVFAGDLVARDARLSPARREAIRATARGLASTPLAPLAGKAIGAIARLLVDADAEARIAFATGGATGAGLSVRRLALTGRGGGFVRVEEGEGFGWQARTRQWRIDGHVVTGGSALPVLDVRLRQAVAGAPVEGVAKLEPYAVGSARLATTPLDFVATGATTRFATVATLDGPVGSGRVRGLVLPIAGHVDARGGFAIGEGCTPLSFRSLAIAGMTLDPARIGVCGADGGALLSRTAGGTLRYGAVVSNLRLTGRSGRAPLAVAAARAAIGAGGVAMRGLSIRLGKDDSVTSFDSTSIGGAFDHGAVSGPFAGGSAAIAHVPLRLDDLAGRWALAGGVLSIGGGLTLSDAQSPRRFEPLVAHDATLRFADGRIDAAAALHEPKSDALVASVVVHHALSSGAGGATLDVPGLHFVPKGLQPEALTPLTLGVVANASGTVAGHGRIDWNGKSVTSSGAFRTDGLDLAAAFGPVSKIAGTIAFTDLLGLVTPPHQTATIAEINPGVAVSDGVVHYQLVGGQKIRIEDARWPFAGGELLLEPTLLGFDQDSQRHLTFRVRRLDAAAFVQQLDFPNIAATGIFDGSLPMLFDQTGGRIVHGELVARGGGTLAYVGQLSSAQIGTMGRLAFDALKAIRYTSLSIALDGRLDGEIVSSVKFDGVRQDTGDHSLVARMIRDLPFRFNITIRAPFRGLVGSARAYIDPSLLLADGVPTGMPPSSAPATVQPVESEPVR